jgi:hypothetical protein
VLLAAVITFSMVSAGVAAADPPKRGQRQVTVMTYNIYFGADLAPVISAPNQQAFVAAVAGAYQQALASDFEGRAEAIADEIAEHEPLLVGIQEATTWSTGPFNDPAPAETITVDFVDLIVKGLADRGLDYSAVVVAQGFDAEAPGFDPGIPFAADVRLQIADLVLARTDLTPAELTILSTSTGSYDALAVVGTPIGPLTFDRQWAAVEVLTYGTEFRFVTTHLEVLDQGLRILQAHELLASHQGSGSPTIYVGDFNDASSEHGAADVMIDAGLIDTWAVARPGDPGPTAGQRADLRNEESSLTRRIDLVFATPEWQVKSADTVGDEAEDKTASGLWPSDHAGVVATLTIKPPDGTPG